MSTYPNLVSFEVRTFSRQVAAYVTVVLPTGVRAVSRAAVERGIRRVTRGRLSGGNLPAVRLVAVATNVDGAINEPAADMAFMPVSDNANTRVLLGATSQERRSSLVRRYRLADDKVAVTESRSGFLSSVAEFLVDARLAAA